MQVFIVEEGWYEERSIWGVYPTLPDAQAQFPDYEWDKDSRAEVWRARYIVPTRINFHSSPPVVISAWDVGDEE